MEEQVEEGRSVFCAVITRFAAENVPVVGLYIGTQKTNKKDA